jgi:hypothetical protein
MKAAVATENGLEILDIPQPKPRPSELLVKVKAAGATGVIFGTSGTDIERELHAFARLVDLRPK